MSRARHKLSASKIKSTELGALYDGGGLQLEKTTKTSGKWIYRYSLRGNRRDMGLGPFPSISLSNARIARDRWETVKLNGDDPVQTRENEFAQKRISESAYDPNHANGAVEALMHFCGSQMI
tara:strand:+ start:508 stop:873 length:366 start_codon:yes stop_codon:yes gene_type:complete